AGVSIFIKFIIQRPGIDKNRYSKYVITYLLMALIVLSYSSWNFYFADDWMQRYYHWIHRLKIMASRDKKNNNIYLDTKHYGNSRIQLSNYLKNLIKQYPDSYIYINEFAPVVAYYTQPKYFTRIQYSFWKDLEQDCKKYMKHKGYIYIKKDSPYQPSYNFAQTNLYFTLMTNINEFGVFSYDPAKKDREHRM
ncbi:MAG: hypothetical protein JW827_02205, partial [Spirochaetes bacterium]|nr:hypothetical protein [Spirochaetota bacterium]